MKRKYDNFEKNIARLIKTVDGQEIPSEAFTDNLVESALSELDREANRKQSFKFIKGAMAAAAVIIIGLGVWIYTQQSGGSDEDVQVTQVTKSPAELITVMALRIAYEEGDMEAVEKQCELAVKMRGPRPGRLTVEKLLEEFNGG